MEILFLRYFNGATSSQYPDHDKRQGFVKTLILSIVFLLLTMVIFFIMEFPVAGYSKIAGIICVVGVGLYFRKTHQLGISSNLLAIASNSMFLADIMYSGGIHSPALYWLMASAFFTILFTEKNDQLSGTVWVIICFLEFITLFLLDSLGVKITHEFPVEWEEMIRLVFVIVFLIYCSIVLLMHKGIKPKSTDNPPSTGKSPVHQIQDGFEQEVATVGQKTHRYMIWIAVLVIPLFPDFVFTTEHWQVFFTLRVGLVLYWILLLYTHANMRFSPNALAYLAITPLIIFLSYITAIIDPEFKYIYNLNYSALFIVASLFVMWKWYHTLNLVSLSLVSYIGFSISLGNFDIQAWVGSGSLLLYTIGFSTIALTMYRMRSFKKEYLLRRDLENINSQLVSKNSDLKEKQEEILLHRNKLKKQNKELNKLNKQLTESEARLKEASALKNKFFSIISHDLRSPIATLSSLLTLINVDEDAMSLDDQKRIFRKLNESVFSIQILMDNLLSWAKSQMDSMTVVRQKFSATEIIKQCLKLFQENLERKNISVSIFEDVSSDCFADKNMIDFVIRNLLSNAIKFTRSGGEIVCLIRKQNDVLQISVRDNGIGIKSDDVEKLFNESSHFSTSGTANEKGTGLGLLLSKEFVIKNGGDIKVTSEYGKGAEFTFTVHAA